MGKRNRRADEVIPKLHYRPGVEDPDLEATIVGFYGTRQEGSAPPPTPVQPIDNIKDKVSTDTVAVESTGTVSVDHADTVVVESPVAVSVGESDTVADVSRTTVSVGPRDTVVEDVKDTIASSSTETVSVESSDTVYPDSRATIAVGPSKAKPTVDDV